MIKHNYTNTIRRHSVVMLRRKERRLLRLLLLKPVTVAVLVDNKALVKPLDKIRCTWMLDHSLNSSASC